MIILIWLAVIFAMILFIGEFRFRQLKSSKDKNHLSLTKRSWTDDIDKDVDMLNIELATSDVIPMIKLSMRGSWRLAQESVMDAEEFAKLRDFEYSKNL